MNDSSLQPRTIGKTELQALPFALGGNAFGWAVDEKTAFGILDRFVDAGFSLVDTADVYTKWVPGNVGGESESMIGHWLTASGKRERVLITTKVGGEMGPGKKGLSANYIRSAVEDSLRRLQTDYIDIYMAHYDDPDTPFEETLGAFGELIDAGKVRALGLSNHDPDRLREVVAASQTPGLPRYDVLQPLYNLYDRQDFEQNYAPICLAENIAVMNFRSLASGFLTGKYRSEEDVRQATRARANRQYMNERGFRILDALDEIAARTGAQQSQVALAWLVARPGVTAPLSSATSVQQLDELIAATRLSLDDDAVQLLDAASAY